MLKFYLDRQQALFHMTIGRRPRSRRKVFTTLCLSPCLKQALTQSSEMTECAKMTTMQPHASASTCSLLRHAGNIRIAQEDPGFDMICAIISATSSLAVVKFFTTLSSSQYLSINALKRSSSLGFFAASSLTSSPYSFCCLMHF